ncbi:hypothetical protein ATK74_1521 [Propionicimonas paludicola]|uniref:Purine nucleoside phosphorylase n=1 Tax=Propionicimonas paludicola TaxID=185243 RepID=A0A2A9CSB3_9ACTN|nr:peptidoglycan editing factor PgeF [Propionicimonas paludicola]PFG16965.1 hypothetical protein ATK74_1521 [Propionicimonas paludicola]
MFSYRVDPGADGVGVAFCDGVAPDGSRLDLGLSGYPGWRSPDWGLVEAEIGVPVLNAYQVHSARVLEVDPSTDAQALARTEADALVSAAPGIGLAVRAADCLPVLFADLQRGLIGAAHAGRVGLAGGVLPATVDALIGLGATQLSAWIGPHICGQCYEVPAALQAEFCVALPQARARTSWDTPSLDLGAAAQAQLVALGVTVTRVDPCTRTTPELHSYRRDGADAGRQAAVIWRPSL